MALLAGGQARWNRLGELCSAQCPPGRYCDEDMSEQWRARWDHLPPVAAQRRQALRCEYRSAEPVGSRECEACGQGPDGRAKTTLFTFACGCAAAGKAEVTAAECNGRACRHHRPLDRFYPVPGDPRCGVSIGHYGWFGPSLAELQIAAVRRYCGDVPILICEDRSPRWEETVALEAVHPGVTVIVNPVRIGHAGGDLGAFGNGIRWAAGLGLEYLVKLSMRFVVAIPRWLQEGARELKASGLPLGSRRAIEHPHQLPLRSEAVVLDVAACNREDLLGYWSARPIRNATEAVIAHGVKVFLGGRWHPWSLFRADREAMEEGILFHVSHEHRPQDYFELAKRLGVELSPEFNAGGSHLIPPSGGGYIIG